MYTYNVLSRAIQTNTQLRTVSISRNKAACSKQRVQNRSFLGRDPHYTSTHSCMYMYMRYMYMYMYMRYMRYMYMTVCSVH